ncbi:hypothetical protein [Erythrobacter sp. Alg231-14]|uniref:hypothetical protein n=1 Tax=Erythrobacter sp. Alg231-14 TaxID=1922225 RepID=UPI000D55E85A
MPKVTVDGQTIEVLEKDYPLADVRRDGTKNAPKKTIGYSISAGSAVAAIALAVDRYGEFAVGAESFASWAIPPLAFAALTATTFAAVKLGYPAKEETDA